MSTVFEDYKYTLDQEVLKELASDIVIDLSKYLRRNNISITDKEHDTVVLLWNLIELKNGIVDFENDDKQKIADIRGYLLYINKYVQILMKRG